MAEYQHTYLVPMACHREGVDGTAPASFYPYAILPCVLPKSTYTAGVGLGANQGHAGGLSVPRLVILERPDEIVHTHAQRSGQFFGRISPDRMACPFFDIRDNGMRYPGMTGQLAL